MVFIITFDILKQIFESVNHLHRNKVIHRDLKPSNILIKLDSPNGRFIKLCDFGISINYELSSTLTTNVGSPFYMAPEVSDGHYTEKADIYSLGVMIKRNFNLFPTSEENLNEYLKNIENLIDKFTGINPTERPTWEMIMNTFETPNFKTFVKTSRSILSNFIQNEPKNYVEEIHDTLNIIHQIRDKFEKYFFENTIIIR